MLLDEDEFADFREYTGDTLMGPYYLLFGNYFTICNQKLEEGLAIFKKENNWRPLEAALFATAAVCDAAKNEYLDNLASIMGKLKDLPTQPHYIRYAAIRMLGRYAKWICKQSTEVIVWSLNYSLNGTWNFDPGQRVFAKKAAEAFCELCEYSAECINNVQMAQSLVNACMQNISKLDVCVLLLALI